MSIFPTEEEKSKGKDNVIESLERTIERTFSVLKLYGVSKERAGSTHNGVECLASRYHKEVDSLRRLVRAWQDKANGEENCSVCHFEDTIMCMGCCKYFPFETEHPGRWKKEY
jgi:hypothetical protein